MDVVAVTHCYRAEAGCGGREDEDDVVVGTGGLRGSVREAAGSVDLGTVMLELKAPFSGG